MMESRMTRNYHVRFGERNEETRQLRGGKVRFVPTPFSPLLANIGLHGLEQFIKRINPKLGIIRYADDFIVTAKDKKSLEQVLTLIKQWLFARGLEISTEKTKMVHIDDGFNFLGFNLRQYKGKLLIKPQKEKVLAFCKKIKETLSDMKARTQEDVIKKLNPLLRGFANCYRGAVSKETFSYIENRVWHYLWCWAKRRHPNKSAKRVQKRYYSSHIVPVAEGGTDDAENLKHLHQACHKQVHSKTKLTGLK